MFLQQIINGLVLGCIYGLCALGFTMIFGVIKLINIAQIDMAMIGAFSGIFIVRLFSYLGINNSIINILFCFLIGIISAGIIGLIIERFAFRPLRSSPPIMGLITSLGISLILENSSMIFFGTDVKVFPHIFPDTAFNLGDVRITLLQIFIIVISLSYMFLLYLFVNKTKIGVAMRATSENYKVSLLMGIDPNKTISLTFFIASGLGASAGLLIAMYYGVARYDMGLLPGIKGFSGAILGGIGSIQGGILGGFIIGLVESLCGGYISTTFKDIFAFIVLILILVLKPSGLLGKTK